MSALSVLLLFTTEQIVLMLLLFYCKGMLEKSHDAKNPEILSFFFVTERTQLIKVSP